MLAHKRRIVAERAGLNRCCIDCAWTPPPKERAVPDRGGNIGLEAHRGVSIDPADEVGSFKCLPPHEYKDKL
jgi:hypothetical protein